MRQKGAYAVDATFIRDKQGWGAGQAKLASSRPTEDSIFFENQLEHLPENEGRHARCLSAATATRLAGCSWSDKMNGHKFGRGNTGTGVPTLKRLKPCVSLAHGVCVLDGLVYVCFSCRKLVSPYGGTGRLTRHSISRCVRERNEECNQPRCWETRQKFTTILECCFGIPCASTGCCLLSLSSLLFAAYELEHAVVDS